MRRYKKQNRISFATILSGAKAVRPLHKVWVIYCLITIAIACFSEASISISFVVARFLILAYIFSAPIIFKRYGNKPIQITNWIIGLITLGLFYDETAQLNTWLFSYADNYLAGVEQWVFASQPSITFSKAFNPLYFVELMNLGYFSYYLIIVSFTIVVRLKSKGDFERYFFVLMTSFYLYFLIFIIFPSAGPQFFFTGSDAAPADGVFFQKIIKWVQENGEVPTGAFPSSHVGITFIILLLSYRQSKPYFFIILPFSVLLFASTVYIKAHYLIDVIAGFVSAPIILRLSTYFWKPFVHYSSPTI